MWTTIDDHCPTDAANGILTEVMRVPGGWLVRCTVYTYDVSHKLFGATSLIFYPSANVSTDVPWIKKSGG